MITFLTDFTDVNRIYISSKLNLKQRSQLGQFLTPAPIARFMAKQFSNLSGDISLLDAGARVGALSAAFVERLLINPCEVNSCHITAYEIESNFILPLKQCLIECCEALANKGINPDLAQGLAAFLNSTLFDKYFRQFSGHTQVNATDLRRIKYPCKDDLIKLGKQVSDTKFDDKQLDNAVHKTLSIMSEAINAVEAGKKIYEALAILKDISAPKKQQNECSALCLLALADIRPQTPWNQATAPARRITEMMDWFREYYGKQYAPNTRETVRRQTMHQFVQMGIVIENPDRPDRPINSPKWCYQLHQQVLSLLKSYGSQQWEEMRQNYAVSIANLLQDRNRNIPMIPVSLPDGQAIELSSGGQNILIKDILESFCPRFTPEGSVFYVGDAGDKFIVNETQKFLEIGIDLNPHGKMPDVVVYYEQQDWLVLIEAVTSHGPVNLKCHNELKQLFKSSTKGLVFVTAFPSRKGMVKYLAEIAWETEVWVADQPEHMIHFNGERFLGPY